MSLPLSTRAALAAILLLAAGLRAGHWASMRERPFVGELILDSEEYDRWGRQIAAGDWLGTQAFFQAPLYPYLLGGVYRVAGGSRDAVYLLQIAAGVAACWALWGAGRRLSGPPAGLAAALLAAAYGPFIFHDVLLLKESLAVALAAFLLAGLARLWRPAGAPARAGEAGVAASRPPPLAGWALAGALAGLLALLRENTLLAACFLLPLAAAGRRGVGRLAGPAALAAGAFLVLLPVGLRNLAVSGSFLLTTYQGGVNFYLGNHPQADGTYRPLVPGKQVPAYERDEPARLASQATGRTLSPREVSRFWWARSLAWARAHPGDFLALQARKLALFWRWYEWPDAVDYYWMSEVSPVLGPPLLEFGGLCLLALAGLWRERRRLADLAPPLAWVVGWTLSVVAFFLFARYRLPAAPALILLAAPPVADWGKAVLGGQARRAAVLAVPVVAAFALPHLAGFAPRRDLVAYNLGLLHDRAGRPEAAAAAFREAAAANPAFALPLLNLGTRAARRGDLAAALSYFSRAVAIEPGSDDGWANLGAARLALGQRDAAIEALDRALALNPTHPQARHNRALAATPHPATPEGAPVRPAAPGGGRTAASLP